MTKLDAIVLADDGLSREKIAGLTARERAVRVAHKLGAERVFVVDGNREELHAWRAPTSGPVLVLRADQLVHTGLAQPLVENRPNNGIAIAVGPIGYAGAILATGAAADSVVTRLARGESDTVIAADAEARIEHGAVACHPIRTREDRHAAHRLLYSILIKPQDNALTRYLYRPISLPLTKLLVWTRVSPNQVSMFVGVIVALGCYLSAQASMSYVIAGTAIILAGQYLDCCDGEIARVKLLSSRFGAWLDTVVDELSSVGYMLAIGWHCHQYFGASYFGELRVDPWIAMMTVGLITYLWSFYCIYYNIIVAVGSANSQDYVGKFDVVPGQHPNSVRLRPAETTAIATKDLPPWLAWIATYAPMIVRRDAITILTLVFAFLHLTQISFLLLAAGGVVTAVIVTRDHIALRRLRRSIQREGRFLESPAR
ncbi:MAG: CDP-alcohol phosphatidyltransferase family protein [Myxococcota bacterium]|nr:CDP-alcohol phosphatidyltransferase family protein [Myxococcota bacterium]